MPDFHDITPRKRRSTNGTYFIDPIDEKHGKMRGKHPTNDTSSTFVHRFRDYGHNRDEIGRKGHQSYHYSHHKGAWSDGVTANRALMSIAQDQARILIKDPIQGPLWTEEYERYRTAKIDQTHYSCVFTYTYTVLYYQLKTQLEADFASHTRTNLIQQFEESFCIKRARELSSISDVSYSGLQIQALATAQAQSYILQRLAQTN